MPIYPIRPSADPLVTLLDAAVGILGIAGIGAVLAVWAPLGPECRLAGTSRETGRAMEESGTGMNGSPVAPIEAPAVAVLAEGIALKSRHLTLHRQIRCDAWPFVAGSETRSVWSAASPPASWPGYFGVRWRERGSGRGPF